MDARTTLALPARRLGTVEWVTLAIVLVLGIMNLPQPFGWDQAMFDLGARKLHEGAVLYRDYWDPKQPGLFWFYQLGGDLFGFNEIGIHAFELIYQLGFAVLLLLSLRSHFTSRWGPAVAVILTVGFYYAVCGDWHFTQIEAVVGFPLFASAWFAYRASEARTHVRGWWWLHGFACGVTVLLKIIFAPIVIGFTLLALLARSRAATAETPAQITLGLGWTALGLALPLSITVAYFAIHRALGLALWTSFVYPTAIVTQANELRADVLRGSVDWFVSRWSPLLVLAALGVVVQWRAGRDRFSSMLILWVVLGAVIILIQRLSYWPYQFLLFAVPLGILAADALVGIGQIAMRLIGKTHPWRVRLALVVSLAALFYTPLEILGAKATSLASARLAVSTEDRLRYQTRHSTGHYYSIIPPEVSFLRDPRSRPGPIFVLGNPLYYWLSGREQATARNGGSFVETFLQREWEWVASDLERRRPPYIFIEHVYVPVMRRDRQQATPFLTMLDRSYRPLRETPTGTWYQLVERR